MSGAASRLTVRWLLALALATSALVVPPAASAVAAADEDGLRLQVDATYTVLLEESVVQVALDVAATNETPNESSGGTVTEFYWDEIVLPVPDETDDLRATSGQARLGTKLEQDDGFKVLTVDLPRNLLFRQTQELRVVFELPGGAPRSASVIRVGQAFASFYAWAYGDDGIGDVRIVLPAGFEATPTGAEFRTSVDERGVTLTAADVADTLEWYAQIDATRDSALTDVRLDLAGGQRVRIRAWPEDEEWRTRVAAALEDGLPVLAQLVGLPWPVSGELQVTEVHTPLLEGYAGIYDAEAEEIQIGEDLDEHTILHEAAHAWFNDDLWLERWISEGFADEFGAIALAEVSDDQVLPEAVAPDDAAAVPLNDWTWPGSIEDEDTDAAEHYGYNASWRVLHALVGEVGPDAMREVLQAAAEGEIAYVGDGDPEAWNRDNDWRRFLDLLEERAGSDKAEATFRAWVVAPEDAELLDRRAEARETYAGLVKAADGWDPPLLVRSPIAAWEFERFDEAAESADAVLEARDALAEEAAALGLDPPASLERAWEGAIESMREAELLVERQQAGLDAIESATGVLAGPRDPLVTLGLWDDTPEQDLADARTAWEADRHDATLAEADAVRATLTGAAELGRTRALIVGAVALAVVLLLVLLVVLITRRR